MQDTTKVSESDVRHLIYKLNIKLGLRWALLGVLDCVDWSTLAGEVSQRVIVEKMNVHRGTLQRSLKELEELGLISINRRVSERGAHRRAHYRISLLTLQSMIKTEATPMPLSEATPMPLSEATPSRSQRPPPCRSQRPPMPLSEAETGRSERPLSITINHQFPSFNFPSIEDQAWLEPEEGEEGGGIQIENDNPAPELLRGDSRAANLRHLEAEKRRLQAEELKRQTYRRHR